MPRTIAFDNFNEFVRYNEPLIEQNPFMYFNLDRTIERVGNREVPVINFFNVMHENSQVCVLLIENECLIYSFDFDEILTPELSSAIQFENFRRYSFFGMKDVIDSLFEYNNVEYSEHKHRIYYGCNSLVDGFESSSGELQMANINRLEQLVELSDNFATEFYEGQKPFENSDITIMAGIAKGNMFQWIIEDRLVGLAQVQYDQFEIPILGFVYTHPDYRGRGIGSSIAYQLTDGLLNQGHTRVRLMTDASNPSSNRAFQKIGFVKEGEYVVRYKEK